MPELISSDVTVNYVKTSGLEDTYTGSFYGRGPDDCILAARNFVIRYFRPATITSAVITPAVTTE